MPRLGESITAYSVLLVLSTIWGLAFVAIKQADAELSPVNLALLRWLVASVPFLALLPIIGRPKTRFEWRDVPRLLLVAFANVVGYHISLNYAETTLSAGLAALLISFGPIFIVILSYFILGERAGRKVLLGLVLAIAGTAVLSTSSISVNGLSSYRGIFEALITALCYALFAVLGKPLVHKYGSASTTIMAGLLGTAMMLPLLSESLVVQAEALSFYGWVSVLYLALLSTVFGYLLFYTLVSRGAVSRLSIQLYLVPVVSVVGGAVLLNEPLTIPLLLGGGMMLAAVAFSPLRGK
jgi:drug/metabolite transporter (DMT)-like permease